MVVTIIQNHPKKTKFIDTYWVIPSYSNTPFSKVCFTRKDKKIFHVMFRDDRLIWAGRQPVMGGAK